MDPVLQLLCKQNFAELADSQLSASGRRHHQVNFFLPTIPVFFSPPFPSQILPAGYWIGIPEAKRENDGGERYQGAE